MKAELIIDTKDTNLEVRRKLFYVSNGTEQREINPRHISSIAILSDVTIKASSLRLAASHDIPLHILDSMGNQILELRSPAYLKHVALRKAQLRFMDSTSGLQWSKEVLTTKTDLQIESLRKWAAAKSKAVRESTIVTISRMESIKSALAEVHYPQQARSTLMGLEESIARLYFRNVSELLPVEYRFSKRSRQPGLDYFNTTLNFLYGLTYTQVSRAILAAGLDTYVGALHTTAYKECLVFDMIEYFRPWIDRLAYEMFVKSELMASHFRPYKAGYWLNKRGKRIVIQRYNDHLYKRIRWQGKVSPLKYHMYRKARELRTLILSTTEDESNLL